MTIHQSLPLNGRIKRETEKALLISFRNGRETWVPKSIVQSNFDTNLTTSQNFILPKWSLEEKHLILESHNENIIGRSGSETYLKSRLIQKGIGGFENIKDIQQFKQSYKKILATSTNNERKKLEAIINELKTEEEQLKKDFEKKRDEFSQSLLKKKEELLKGDLPPRDEKRVKKIDKILEKKPDKPFKSDLKQIKKSGKEIDKREKKIEIQVEKAVQPIKKAKEIIAINQPHLTGAVGETGAIKELRKLPNTYFTINEATLRFDRAIRWKKYGDYVKSCRIDHVVVGPTGIFLIETKNWSAQRLKTASFTPHKQIERAGYIFFIHMMDHFGRKFPVFKVVATLRKLPQLPHDYVDQITIRELSNYILEKRQSLDSKDIQYILKWLTNFPYIKNSKPFKYMPIRKKRYFRFKGFSFLLK